jgi:hypothetical protein
MRFACVKAHNNTGVLRIDVNVADAFDFQQRFAQFSDALLAIVAFGRDLDCFENSVIGALGIEGIGRIGFVWSRWVHSFLVNVRRMRRSRNFARDRFKHAPDVFDNHAVAGGVRVNIIR